MASNYWMKFYYEVVDDPKMGRLPDNLWRRFFECCALAGEMNQEGRLPPIHDIAWRLHIDEEALRIEFDQMARIGLVDYINKPLDEHWIIVNFAKRQARMTSTERVQRKRERDKKGGYYERCYGSETNRSIDKDIDIDTEEEARPSAEYPPETWAGPRVQKFVTDICGIAVSLNIERQQNVKNAIINYGLEKTEAVLSESFAGWCDTKSERDGRKYNPYNTGWIDWGIEYLLNGNKRWDGSQPMTYVEQMKAAGYGDARE